MPNKKIKLHTPVLKQLAAQLQHNRLQPQFGLMKFEGDWSLSRSKQSVREKEFDDKSLKELQWTVYTQSPNFTRVHPTKRRHNDLNLVE